MHSGEVVLIRLGLGDSLRSRIPAGGERAPLHNRGKVLVEGDPRPSVRLPSKAFAYSRDHRADRPQVVIGLDLDDRGVKIVCDVADRDVHLGARVARNELAECEREHDLLRRRHSCLASSIILGFAFAQMSPSSTSGWDEAY